MEFVLAKDVPGGKRAGCVAGILEKLVAAEGEPVPYRELLEEVGMEDQPAQMQPALHALEFSGVVERYTYAEDGTRQRTAYALAEGVEVES